VPPEQDREDLAATIVRQGERPEASSFQSDDHDPTSSEKFSHACQKTATILEYAGMVCLVLSEVVLVGMARSPASSGIM
jgi:hypothetical protein